MLNLFQHLSFSEMSYRSEPSDLSDFKAFAKS